MSYLKAAVVAVLVLPGIVCAETFVLEAADATINAAPEGRRASLDKRKNLIGSWHNYKTTVSWDIEVLSPGTVDVTCIQAAAKTSEGNRYDIVIGEQRVTGTVVNTGRWDEFESVNVGSMVIDKPGRYIVEVIPHATEANAVMNLRGIQLTMDSNFEAVLPQQIQLEAKTATIESKHGNHRASINEWDNLIGSWHDHETTVSWELDVQTPGTIYLTIIQAADQSAENNDYDVMINGQRLTAQVVNTEGFGRFKENEIGQLTIDRSGRLTLHIVPHPTQAPAIMNIRGMKVSGDADFQAKQIVPPERQRGFHFSKKTYSAQPLPRFASSRSELPEPVIESRPDYLEMYWRCWELAFDHLKKADHEHNGFVSDYLDEAFNSNIFQWDTVFMVMFARYGHHIFPAVQSFDNFYCKQHYDGFICREIRETTGEDFHKKTSTQAINPPLFSWAEMESYRVTGDQSRFEMVLPVLERYVQWLETGRKREDTVHGLYWSNGLGSGMDNTPRSGSGWVDMSAQMVMQYNDLAAMCDVLGYEEKAQTYRARATEIGDLINKWMWNEDDGLYYDVDDDGEHIKWKTAGCFWPMLAGITSKAQEEKLIANLKDPDSFWRQNVFPTLAADQEHYDPSGGYWKGGVWAPTNYAIIRGLAKQGHDEFAREAVHRYLDEMYKIFEKTGTVWELYAPDMVRHGSGAKGLEGPHQARPDFVGWTGCGPIAMLIENILGFEVQGANQKIIWTVSRTDRHGIKNLRFGDIRTSLICEARDSANAPLNIQVETDKPYTLIVRHSDKTETIDISPQTKQITVD